MRYATLFVLVVTWTLATAGAEEATSAWETVLYDYARGPAVAARPGVVMWNWTDQLKEQAATFTRLETVRTEGDPGQALALTVTDQLPWQERESFRVLRIGPSLLPPTADAIRLRYKVTEGQVTVSVGGPTVYFGHSDVISEPATLTADDTGQWRTVTFSLHDRLIRNFRRARFGREAPVIYYTRWVQEPMQLNIHRGSVGGLLLERVELLHTGRGRAYPTFEPGEVTVVASMADFSEADAMAGVFSALHEDLDFERPPHLPRPTWKPPIFSHVADAEDRRMLRIEHQGAEEVVFSGIRTVGRADANAIAIDLQASHPSGAEELSLDLLAYVAPVGPDGATTFPWDRFAPPQAWRGQIGVSFDYYLGPTAMRDVSYAFYHARRPAKNGQPVRWIVPLADFICVHGAGDMASALTQHKPIAPQQLIAVGLLPSWAHHTAATTIDIRRIQWVRVPGDATSLRSFPQVSDVQQVRIVPWQDPTYGGTRQMVPPAP